MRKESGSALITVVLVVLVLTMVGLAGALYMTVENKISQNDELQKEAFYAAESGLRAGEGFLVDSFSAGKSVTDLLQHTSVVSTPAVVPHVPIQPVQDTIGRFTVDNGHLGTYLTAAGGTTEYADQLLPAKTASGAAPSTQSYYSLYVRNNPGDLMGTPTEDQDLKFSLVCVGWVQNASGQVLASKILEEGFDLSVRAKVGSQANLNAAGTNTGTF